MEKKEWSLEEWINKASRYCAMAEKAEAEVRDKLYQWGTPVAMHDSIIQYLRSENYLNDSRYCQAFVHDKVAYQSWGRQKIRMALQTKQLDADAIQAAMENIDESVYFSNLQHLISLRKKEEKEKVFRFLLQRGYTYREIHSCYGK